MINVRLFLPVEFKRGSGEFWKDIQMPCLPPDECVFLFDEAPFDGDCRKVFMYWYVTTLQVFVVELQFWDLSHTDCGPELLTDCGWQTLTRNNDWSEAPFVLSDKKEESQ